MPSYLNVMIEGCCHGALDDIYAALVEVERRRATLIIDAPIIVDALPARPEPPERGRGSARCVPRVPAVPRRDGVRARARRVTQAHATRGQRGTSRCKLCKCRCSGKRQAAAVKGAAVACASPVSAGRSQQARG